MREVWSGSSHRRSCRKIDAQLSIAYKLSVNRLLLRAQVIAQNLIEALQAHTFCFFLFVVTNLLVAPDALDHEGRLVFSFFFHSPQTIIG